MLILDAPRFPQEEEKQISESQNFHGVGNKIGIVSFQQFALCPVRLGEAKNVAFITTVLGNTPDGSFGQVYLDNSRRPLR